MRILIHILAQLQNANYLNPPCADKRPNQHPREYMVSFDGSACRMGIFSVEVYFGKD